MKYMMLIYMAENAMTEAERQACFAESTGLARELHAAGKFITASPLKSIKTATSVRLHEGKRLITDGPFAETREALGGFYLIDARDLEEAIGIAARIPPANKGTIEIRPVVEMAGLPEAKS